MIKVGNHLSAVRELSKIEKGTQNVPISILLY